MFLIHLEDTSPVSAVGDPTNPAYSPIYIELDSTDVQPPPSEWIRCYVSLPAGYISLKNEAGTAGGALIKFEGTTAGMWQITTDNPSIVPTPTTSAEIRVSVLNNTPSSFWIRGRTTYGEIPVDDRSAALRVSGQVEEV